MLAAFRILLCLAALTGGAWAGSLADAQSQQPPGIVAPKPPAPPNPPVDPPPDPKAVLPANATGKTGQPFELKANTAGEIDWEVPGEFYARHIPAEKTVLLVPKVGGTYVVRLAVCEGGKPRIHRCVVFVEGLVPPPPGPGPGPEPGPGPKPVPTPDGGLRVLFLRETNAPLTAEQTHTLNSVKLAAYLNAKCAKGEGGQPGWRVWDPQQDVTNADPVMRQLFNDSKAEAAKALPALVIASGKQAVVYPLPATEAETLALLKKYGGE